MIFVSILNTHGYMSFIIYSSITKMLISDTHLQWFGTVIDTSLAITNHGVNVHVYDLRDQMCCHIRLYRSWTKLIYRFILLILSYLNYPYLVYTTRLRCFMGTFFSINSAIFYPLFHKSVSKSTTWHAFMYVSNVRNG